MHIGTKRNITLLYSPMGYYLSKKKNLGCNATSRIIYRKKLTRDEMADVN